MSEIISIIVPIYNAEKYLERCICSILKQTYRNIELILVNDGSTDRSYSICLAWRERDCRVNVYTQKNSGVSAARNLALMNIQGRYVVFVDADDYLEFDFCEKMVDVIQQSNVDVVFCEKNLFLENESRLVVGENSEIVTKISSKEFEYYGKTNRSTVWGALYKANLLENIKFSDDIAVGEDGLFLAKVIRKTDTIAYYSKPMYNYTVQNQSAYHGKFTERKSTEIDAWLQICKLFDLNSVTGLSAEARCAEVAFYMIRRYVGDDGFESKYINRLIHVYRSKLPRLIRYDHLKKRKTFKHILQGFIPHVFVKYWKLKDGKKSRNCNDI